MPSRFERLRRRSLFVCPWDPCRPRVKQDSSSDISVVPHARTACPDSYRIGFVPVRKQKERMRTKKKILSRLVLVVALSALKPLVPLLRLKRQGRDRPGLEAL